jgi:hypothetical protein
VEATVVINAAEPDRVTDTTGTRLTDTDVLLCDAILWPIITTFDGLPLAMGRSQRFATPHQVRMVNLRDGGCVFPGCGTPAAWVDLHHADAWGHRGHTDTDRRLASHPKALAYLAAVVNLDRLTPQRAAENRWADHLAEQAQALKGLKIAVNRLLRQLTGVARMQVPDLVPNQELATLCRELRDAGWVVDLELSGDGGTRRLVLATPGEQLPISEPTALRQALAETLRAVSYDAMPAWLISQAAAAVEAMLVERVHAIPESIGAREAGA